MLGYWFKTIILCVQSVCSIRVGTFSTMADGPGREVPEFKTHLETDSARENRGRRPRSNALRGGRDAQSAKARVMRAHAAMDRKK